MLALYLQINDHGRTSEQHLLLEDCRRKISILFQTYAPS